MNSDCISQYRRKFLKNLALIPAALPAMSIIAAPKVAFSSDKVTEDDPVAVSLNYVHDASTATARTDENAICETCQLYTPSEEDGWGGCSIFQGKLVNANGWCSAWIVKS